MSEGDVVSATSRPVTASSLVRDLRVLGVETGVTLFVHSSLKSLGWVAGAAQAVVLALQEAVGETGTLAMPAHSTSLSEPSQWQHPPVPESWWATIRAETPPFDPRLTPTRGMGRIAELFRTMPGVVRSYHFPAIGAAFEAATSEVTTGNVANAESRLMRQRPLVDFGVEWIEQHRGRGRLLNPH